MNKEELNKQRIKFLKTINIKESKSKQSVIRIKEELKSSLELRREISNMRL